MFGTVNYVKIIYDNKTGQSKGYGFLYMQTAKGAAAVEKFAISQNCNITMLGRSNVYCARHNECHMKQNGIVGNTNGQTSTSVNVTSMSSQNLWHVQDQGCLHGQGIVQRQGQHQGLGCRRGLGEEKNPEILNAKM